MLVGRGVDTAGVDTTGVDTAGVVTAQVDEAGDDMGMGEEVLQGGGAEPSRQPQAGAQQGG